MALNEPHIAEFAPGDPSLLSLDDLAVRLANELPGWQWLARTDETYGGFANVTTPDFSTTGPVLIGQRYPVYGATPAVALHAALSMALSFGGGLH